MRKDFLNSSRDGSALILVGREFHSLAPRYEKLFFKISVLGFTSAKLRLESLRL